MPNVDLCAQNDGPAVHLLVMVHMHCVFGRLFL